MYSYIDYTKATKTTLKQIWFGLVFHNTLNLLDVAVPSYIFAVFHHSRRVLGTLVGEALQSLLTEQTPRFACVDLFPIHLSFGLPYNSFQVSSTSILVILLMTTRELSLIPYVLQHSGHLLLFPPPAKRRCCTPPTWTETPGTGWDVRPLENFLKFVKVELQMG